MQDLLNNVYYGTLRQIAEDLSKQIEDHDSFYEGKRKPDAKELAQHGRLVEMLGQVLKTYCGEGGIPLDNTGFSEIARKYFAEEIGKTIQASY